MSSHTIIARKVIYALLAGVIVGLALSVSEHITFWGWPHFRLLMVEYILPIGGQIFLRLLQLLLVPVVLFSLIQGIANLSDINQLGSLGLRCFALYILTTVLAISLALLLASRVHFGAALHLIGPKAVMHLPVIHIKTMVLGFIPTNIIKAFYDANLIQVIMISILIGIALLSNPKLNQRVSAAIEVLYDMVIALVMVVLRMAPIGVFCLVGNNIAHFGYDMLMPMMTYFLVVIGALCVQVFLVYASLLRCFTSTKLWTFLHGVYPALAYAFGTSSSSASIPVTLKVVQSRLGVSPVVSAFVIPLGATINMDGTAIMQGVATVFIAQLYGLSLGIGHYLLIILMATIASIGAAGIPSAGVITLAMVLQQLGLPLEAIGIIMGVDRLLDMLRSAVNVTGDSVVSIIIDQYHLRPKACVPKDSHESI